MKHSPQDRHDYVGPIFGGSWQTPLQSNASHARICLMKQARQQIHGLDTGMTTFYLRPQILDEALILCICYHDFMLASDA